MYRQDIKEIRAMLELKNRESNCPGTFIFIVVCSFLR